jgi:hypothetical protein
MISFNSQLSLFNKLHSLSSQFLSSNYSNQHLTNKQFPKMHSSSNKYHSSNQVNFKINHNLDNNQFSNSSFNLRTNNPNLATYNQLLLKSTNTQLLNIVPMLLK